MFNKKYKKGIADAAKAYEAFGKKQEKAIEAVLQELRQGNIDISTAIQSLKGNIDNLYSYLESKEKAELYTVYTPFDIKELDQNERLFLVGALLRLTQDKDPTETQQNYLRSIQKYLEIKEPPFGIDLTAIENIENMLHQKAIYQVALEYLALQDGDFYDETELQQEFLESFNLNSKNRQIIADRVETLYSATGALGISEKYGYVSENDEDSKDSNQNNNDALLEENEKKAVLLTLKHYKNQYFCSVKDYLWLNGDDNIIINRLTGTIENADWLPKKSITYSDGYVFYDNLCCFVSANECYLIDFENSKYRKLNQTFNRPELVAMNGKYLVGNIPSTAKMFIVDFVDDSINYINDCGVSITFNENEIINCNYDNISKYDCDTKRRSELFSIEGIDPNSIEASCIYKDKIFVLNSIHNYNYPLQKHSIYSLDLQSNQLKLEADGLYSYGIGAYYHHNGGWYFINEESAIKPKYSPDFKLTYFSFETCELIELAKNCGYTIEGKAGFLGKKSDLSSYPSSLSKWGNYIFFKTPQGGYNHQAHACVSINKPNEILLGE